MTTNEKEAYFNEILHELSTRQLATVRATLEHLVLQQEAGQLSRPYDYLALGKPETEYEA